MSLGDQGKSNKPARIILVATHADVKSCSKNAVGEHNSKDADYVLKQILTEFGNIFDLHPRTFVLDANVSNSQDMKTLKHAISELKTEIIDVSTMTISMHVGLFNDLNGQTKSSLLSHA